MQVIPFQIRSEGYDLPLRLSNGGPLSPVLLLPRSRARAPWQRESNAWSPPWGTLNGSLLQAFNAGQPSAPKSCIELPPSPPRPCPSHEPSCGLSSPWSLTLAHCLYSPVIKGPLVPPGTPLTTHSTCSLRVELKHPKTSLGRHCQTSSSLVKAVLQWFLDRSSCVNSSPSSS